MRVAKSKGEIVLAKIRILLILTGLFLIFLNIGFAGQLEAADYSRLREFYENGQTIRVNLDYTDEEVTFELQNNTQIRDLASGTTENLSAGNYRLFISQSEFETEYFVQVLAAEEEQRAAAMKEELNNGGFTEVNIVHEDELYKVQVGNEPTRQDASRLENELVESGFAGWIGDREEARKNYLVLEEDNPGNNQEILTTTSLAIESGMYLDNSFYPGEIELLLTEDGLKKFQEIDINILVSNKIFQLQQKTNLDILSSPVISALSMVIRSQLLWDYIQADRGYLESENYKGTARFSRDLVSTVETIEDYYLSDGKELLRGYFHQNSGGITGSPELVSGANYNRGLSSVEDTYSPEYNWSEKFTETFIQERLLVRVVEMMPALNMVPADLRDISVDSRTSCGRVEAVNIRTDYGSFIISDDDIDELLQTDDFSLPSKLFEIAAEKQDGVVANFTIQGRGRGKGLGIPIESAVKMAEEENNWREILNFFYPEAEVTELQEILLEDQLVNARVQRGLNYQEIRHFTVYGSRTYTKLELDLDRRRLKAVPALAGGSISSGTEDIVDLGREINALAGINGGFFDGRGRPLGLFMQNGEIVTDQAVESSRTALLFDEQGNLSINRHNWQGSIKFNNTEIEISGVNRAANNNEAVLINKYYGNTAPRSNASGVEMVVNENNEIQGIHRGNLTYTLTIPEKGYIIQARGEKADKLGRLNSGETILFEDKIVPEPDLDGEIAHVLGAGPRLLKDGEIFITAEEEDFQEDIIKGRAPRSALGITSDNRLILITVDGRQPHRSVGINLKNLARLMQESGAVEAMNLDGGASARMMVRGFTMNVPSAKRLVSNAIMIIPQDF